MKATLALALWASLDAVAAFPTLQSIGATVQTSRKDRRQSPPFDAASQLVSTSGIHAVGSLSFFAVFRV